MDNMIDVSDWPIAGPDFQLLYTLGWSLLMLDGRLWMVRP